MLGVALVGYGYWGPNLARNFSAMPNVSLRAVCDRRPEMLSRARAAYPTIITTSNPEELFDRTDIDVVLIATPLSTHFDLARRALQAGKHVWVEKPLAGSVEQATILVSEAKRMNRILHVDHTYVYTPAVRRIRELVRDGALGKIYYYDSVRINLGIFQHDTNVIWDLAVHDLSILDHLVGEPPMAVSALAVSHVPNTPENIAYLTLFYSGQLIAHVHVNWLAPVKIRQVMIGGSDKMVMWDDVEPSEKLRVYDKGIMVSDSETSRLQKLVGYRTGDMWAPRLERTEALQIQANHFVECIRNGTSTMTDGESGLRVLRILEAASLSVQDRGKLIPVEARD